MRNSPTWVIAYMAVVKAGAIATLINGWWEALEMEHAIRLTDRR
jgi:Acyl-CoA synthetases (AMP-forming)/AMP-acid ligases II